MTPFVRSSFASCFHHTRLFSRGELGRCALLSWMCTTQLNGHRDCGMQTTLPAGVRFPWSETNAFSRGEIGWLAIMSRRIFPAGNRLPAGNLMSRLFRHFLKPCTGIRTARESIDATLSTSSGLQLTDKRGQPRGNSTRNNKPTVWASRKHRKGSAASLPGPQMHSGCTSIGGRICKTWQKS